MMNALNNALNNDDEWIYRSSMHATQFCVWERQSHLSLWSEGLCAYVPQFIANNLHFLSKWSWLLGFATSNDITSLTTFFGSVVAVGFPHVTVTKLGPQDDPEAFVDLFE